MQKSLVFRYQHTKVRFPLFGPHILIKPTVKLPAKHPNTAQRAASLKLRPSTSVPIDPTTMLFVANVMLNHISSIWSMVEDVIGSRSSIGMGSMPRLSTFLKLAAHREHLDCGTGSGFARSESEEELFEALLSR